MRIVSLTTAAVFALAVAACNNNDSGSAISTEANLAEDSAVNDVLGANQAGNATAAMPTDPAGFATAVAAADLYEIESSRLAAAKATSSEVKQFAQHIQTDHEKSSADLKAAAAKASPPVTVTPALDAEKRAMLDELRAASGKDFDRRFIDQQTNAHQKALLLLQNYAGRGDSQPLKDFAANGVKVVQGHLEHLNGIQQ